MPDIHWGYGFPIGGVAATRRRRAASSRPGGVGYDINCGVRLLRTDLDARRRPAARSSALADALFRARARRGVGRRRAVHARRRASSTRVLARRGARWAVDARARHGRATSSAPRSSGALRRRRSRRGLARGRKQRGADQLGTLGSGNHFLEVQVVDEIFDAAAARGVRARAGRQVAVMIHSGSRGLGHQVCTDYVAAMDRGAGALRHRAARPAARLRAARLARGPSVPRRDGGRGELRLGQPAAHRRTRSAGASRACFGRGRRALGPAPGLRRRPQHRQVRAARGRRRASSRVCVHRKGATRAFPAGHPDVPEPYRAVGQPVLIPGDMGRCSFVGRRGRRARWTRDLRLDLPRRRPEPVAPRGDPGPARRRRGGASCAAEGIVVRAERRDLLAEEASLAYKDVEAVVSTAERAGLIRPVARLRPLAVVKG